MTETGKVTKIDGSFVTVNCKPFPACHCCGGKICAVKGRDILAHNPRSVRLAAGDYAEISLSASRTVVPLLRVFGLPLAAFAAAYAASAYIFEDTEKVRVLSGFAGCLLGAAAAFLLGRLKNVFPEVTRAVPAPDSFAQSGESFCSDHCR